MTLLVTGLWLGGLLIAQNQTSTTTESDLVKAWLAVSQKHADDYEIYPVGVPNKRFGRLPQAVFRHSQPTRGNDIGAVYLWIDADSRPVMVGTVFAWTRTGDARNVTHEFHSLMDAPLDVRFRGQNLWSPAVAGVEWKLIPDAPVPAESKTARVRQGRELVRRFSANSIDRTNSRWELRTVPQPIHQYDVSSIGPTQSGTLFAVCQGTDPELFIVLESRKTADGYRWHFACASFTDFALQVRLDDKEVWTGERYKHGFETTGPHSIKRVMTEVTFEQAQ